MKSILFLFLTTATCAQAWNLPLPGGKQISYNEGILRIQLEAVDTPPIPPIGSVPSGTTLNSIQVRDTRTSKGYGAFCTAPLAKDEFLGFYEGEETTSIEESDNTEYIMSMDGGVTFLDGYTRAQNRSIFSPCHLNHADKDSSENNCVRVLEEGRVAFFTSRKIEELEELCFDYGDNYWRGREGDKL